MLKSVTFSLVFFSFFLCAHLNAQTWYQVDDFPGTERDDGVSFVINDIAYCGTGYKSGWTETNDFYALNMQNDTWTEIASLPSGKERQYASGFSSTTHGFVFGGLQNANYLNDLWSYDPATDQWTERSPLP